MISDGEAAKYCAERIVDAAKQRAREGVEQDAGHHVWVQIDDRRHHHACDRADRRGEAPAKRQHPADADADETRGYRIESGSTHRQAQLGVTEEQIDREQHDERHARGAQFMAGDVAAEQHRAARERCREGLYHVVEDPAGAAVDDQQQADEYADRGEHRGVHHWPHQDALDQQADEERGHDGEDEGDPVGQAEVDQGERNVGGECRHLALGEVHVVRRLVDHHEGKRDRGVDAAAGDARQNLVQHAFHGTSSLTLARFAGEETIIPSPAKRGRVREEVHRHHLNTPDTNA